MADIATGIDASISTKYWLNHYNHTSFQRVFVETRMEGVPTLVLEKLLDQERSKQASLPQDTRSSGVLRIPENMSAPMLEGDAQRNVPAILKMIEEEARKAEKMKQKAMMREGEGLSLPLSRGIMTGSMDKVMSYMSVFD